MAKPRPAPQIIDASFTAGAATLESLPAPSLAEVAFAGRSNVGKSSLMNALTDRRNLVRASNTPGTTRALNLFHLRAADGLELQLVDLPGYGFAQRSKHERKVWGKLIESYLTTRVTLRAVVLLIDVRRGVEDDDRELLDFMAAAKGASRAAPRVIVVVTKIDKLASSGRKPAVGAIQKALGLPVLGFSAHTHEGRDELWSAVRRAVLGDPIAVPNPDAEP